MKATVLLKRGEAPSAFRVSRSAFRVPGISTVDQVMAEERAAAFTKRSLKASAKLAGLKLVVGMCDFTTLEGKDTLGKVAYLCRKGKRFCRECLCLRAW